MGLESLYDKDVRDVGELLGDGEHYLIVLLLYQHVQIGQQCVFDSIGGHERGDDGDLVDGVDADGEVVAI